MGLCDRCATLARRFYVRPALLFCAASTCLQLLFVISWSHNLFDVGLYTNICSVAAAYVTTSSYTSPAVVAQQQTTAPSMQPHSSIFTVAVPSSTAHHASAYHYPATTAVPATSTATVMLPSTVYSTESAEACEPAASAGTAAPAVTHGSTSATTVHFTTAPECTVRALPLPASTVGVPTSSVVVVPASTRRRTSTSTVLRQLPRTTYVTSSGGPLRTATTATTTLRQQPEQTVRAHKPFCIRAPVWQSPHLQRETGGQTYEAICAPVSALHTYHPVAQTVSRTVARPTLRVHTQVGQSVLPQYVVTKTDTGARTDMSALPEEYTYSDGETDTVHHAISGASDKTREKRSVAHLPGDHIQHIVPPPDPSLAADGRGFAGHGAPLPLLQMEIDEFCRNRFKMMCSSQGGPFCTSSPIVGRYGPGGQTDRGGWGCYNKDEMSMATRSMGCVDQCGSLMRCLGSAGPSTTTIHAPELDEWVLQRKWQHCSAYQQAADALCNFKNSGDLARYDDVRKRWMCLDLDDITFEGSSYCVDNCGGPVPCVGGLVFGLVPRYTVHIVQHPDMERAFEAIQPCPDLNDVCIATVLNPPRCVSQATTITIQRFSGQQEQLDQHCQEDSDDACRRKMLKEECFRLWLARFDVSSGGSEERAWRCYPESSLDFTLISQCADGCGNLVPCRGAPIGPKPFAVHSPHALRIMADPSYCSEYQRAGNNFCKAKYGSGYVARQHCKSFKWQCLQKDHLPSLGWNGCIGHCGEYISCPSGVDESVTAPEAEDPGLLRAIMSVPDPCPAGEECEPLRQAPPYCSISRPRPINNVSGQGPE